MYIPWTKPKNTGTSNKVALILTENPENYQPVVLKCNQDIIDDEVTIISQYYDDFSDYEKYRKKYPDVKIIAVAVLGYPCRNETIINKDLPKIAGFWSKLAFIIEPNTTIFLDKEFSCFSSFLTAVGLILDEHEPDGYHFSASSNQIESTWLRKYSPVKNYKKKLPPIPRSVSLNYLLYTSCRNSDVVNPIEDIFMSSDEYEKYGQYWKSVSYILHDQEGMNYDEIRRKIETSKPSVENFANYLIKRRDSNKRFTLISIDITDIEMYSNVLLLDWDVANVYLFNLNYETKFPAPPVVKFANDLIYYIEFKLINVKSGPELYSWQTYGDILFRFMEYIQQIAMNIDNNISKYVLPSNENEVPVKYDQAVTYIKNHLFGDKYIDKTLSSQRVILGKNLLNWYKSLNSTYPNQVDLQVSYYLIKLIGDASPEMDIHDKEKYYQLFLTSWVQWTIEHLINKEGLTLDNAYRNYLEESIVSTDFKILLEFSRYVYLQETSIKPPNTCLIYLSDQHLNLFYSENEEIDN